MGALFFFLFVGTVFFILFSLITGLIHFIRKNASKGRRVLLRAVVALVMYAGLLLGVSFTSGNTILPLNQDKCFDDWCAAVTQITAVPANDNTDYQVQLKISNQGRGRAQKPDHPEVYVLDTQGKRYDESSAAKLLYEPQFGTQPPLDQRIEAQTSFMTTLFFRLPANTQGSVVITEGGGPVPLIIGEEKSFFHGKSMTPLF